MDLIKIAESFRKETGQCGGVVIIYGVEAAGWMNEIRDPEHWVPGSVAVNADNTKFMAIGGNDYNGAEKWARIN